ncbi:hypothetical protein ACNKHM_01560 [Shigella sonnei]
MCTSRSPPLSTENSSVKVIAAIRHDLPFQQSNREVAMPQIQQNPGQLKKPATELTNGDKKAVTLLDESHLTLCWISSLVMPNRKSAFLIPARYHHMRPASLEKVETCWPKLQIDFMTIHASKGQQADYVIIVGLQEGSGGLPAAAW